MNNRHLVHYLFHLSTRNFLQHRKTRIRGQTDQAYVVEGHVRSIRSLATTFEHVRIYNLITVIKSVLLLVYYRRMTRHTFLPIGSEKKSPPDVRMHDGAVADAMEIRSYIPLVLWCFWRDTTFRFCVYVCGILSDDKWNFYTVGVKFIKWFFHLMVLYAHVSILKWLSRDIISSNFLKDLPEIYNFQ